MSEREWVDRPKECVGTTHNKLHIQSNHHKANVSSKSKVPPLRINVPVDKCELALLYRRVRLQKLYDCKSGLSKDALE